MIDQAPTREAPLPPGVTLLIIATVSSTIGGFLVSFARHFRELGWRVDAAISGAPRDPGLLETAPDIVHVHTPIAGHARALDLVKLVRRPSLSVRAVSPLPKA